MGNGEGCVEHPIYGGKPTHCRSTMYTLVKMLKPINILEIGSWEYESSNIMSLALEHNNTIGIIDSFDIIDGGYTQSNIKPVGKFVNAHFWMPHHTTYDTWKYNSNIKYKEFINMNNKEIFEFNKSILLGLNRTYDLILIDGDHSYDGVTFDLEYAKLVSNKNTVFVVDDLYDIRHSQVRSFFDNLPYYKYDWKDWNDSGKD